MHYGMIWIRGIVGQLNVIQYSLNDYPITLKITYAMIYE